jgi:hypothetical protein
MLTMKQRNTILKVKKKNRNLQNIGSYVAAVKVNSFFSPSHLEASIDQALFIELFKYPPNRLHKTRI